MKTAGKLALPLPTLQREFGGFRDLARSSMFGAGISGLLTTLTTGNPLAGLAVAGADVLGSTAIAGGIGKLGKKKVFGKTVNFAGGPAINIREADVPEKIRKDMMTGKVGKDFQDFMSKNTQFAPSVPQTLGQIAGSYGAIMTVEPMFYPNRPDASNTAASQGDVTVQQLMQRHGYSQILTNPAAARRVLTNENSQIPGSEGGGNPIYNSNLAPGTLYQMAGNPMRGM